MGYEQLQVFIEPKGTHLIAEGKWKEDFLLEIEDKAVATKSLWMTTNTKSGVSIFLTRMSV